MSEMSELVGRLAREARVTDPDLGPWMTDYGDSEDAIMRFAALVAAECARIAMTCPVDAYCTEAHMRQRDAQRITTAAAIRERFGIKEGL